MGFAEKAAGWLDKLLGLPSAAEIARERERRWHREVYVSQQEQARLLDERLRRAQEQIRMDRHRPTDQAIAYEPDAGWEATMEAARRRRDAEFDLIYNRPRPAAARNEIQPPIAPQPIRVESTARYADPRVMGGRSLTLGEFREAVRDMPGMRVTDWAQALQPRDTPWWATVGNPARGTTSWGWGNGEESFDVTTESVATIGDYDRYTIRIIRHDPETTARNEWVKIIQVDASLDNVQDIIADQVEIGKRELRAIALKQQEQMRRVNSEMRTRRENGASSLATPGEPIVNRRLGENMWDVIHTLTGPDGVVVSFTYGKDGKKEFLPETTLSTEEDEDDAVGA